MVRIYWKSKITGHEGHGESLLPVGVAEKFCNDLNKEFPELDHFIMDKKRIEGLLLLVASDGLPPNIKLTQVPVHLDWENNLVLDYSNQFFQPRFKDDGLDGVSKTDIELDLFEVNGKKYLAGFSDELQQLVVGYL